MRSDRAPFHTVLLGLLLVSASGATAEVRSRQGWSIAPPGACAEAPARALCTGGACTRAAALARDRFDPFDVAAGAGGPGAAGSSGMGQGGGAGLSPPLPSGIFSGPGSCADPSTPCSDRSGVSQSARSGLLPPPGTGVVEQPPGPVRPPGLP